MMEMITISVLGKKEKKKKETKNETPRYEVFDGWI